MPDRLGGYDIGKVFFIFSTCSRSELSLISERKMISVHNAVIAMILVSCLEHTVDMF